MYPMGGCGGSGGRGGGGGGGMTLVRKFFFVREVGFLHLFALVFMAGLRPSIAKILSLSKQEPGAYINIKQHGLIVSATFIGVLLFIHHIMYFLLETFASSGLSYGLLRTFASLFFSLFISMILLLVINPGRNER